MSLLEFVGYARKAFVALAAAFGVLATSLVDGTITSSEWGAVAVAFFGAVAVYSVKNEEKK